MSIRFSGCWTILVVGSYLLLFLHPTLSRTPIASVGVQGIWICLTWILWIVAAAYLNAVLPFVTVYSQCALVYCGQLKALFGKFYISHVLNELTDESLSNLCCANVRKTPLLACRLIRSANISDQRLLRVCDVRYHVACVAKSSREMNPVSRCFSARQIMPPNNCENRRLY